MTREQLCIAVANHIYRDLLFNGLGNAEAIGKKLVEELERLNVLNGYGEENKNSSDAPILRE